MNTWVLAVVVALGVAALIGTAVLLVRDRPGDDLMFGVLIVLEVALVVQAVVGLVLLSGTSRDVEGLTFVSYLIGELLVLPIGAFWSLAERTRAGTAVLAVAVFTVLAMELRLHSVWAAGA